MPRADILVFVEDLVTRLWPDRKVVKAVVAEYEVDESTAYTYLNRVYADMPSDNPDARAKRRSQMAATAVRKHEELSTGDAKMEAVAQKYFEQLAKIEGVYAPEQLKVLQTEMKLVEGLSEGDLDGELLEALVVVLQGLAPEKKRLILEALEAA